MSHHIPVMKTMRWSTKQTPVVCPPEAGVSYAGPVPLTSVNNLMLVPQILKTMEYLIYSGMHANHDNSKYRSVTLRDSHCW